MDRDESAPVKITAAGVLKKFKAKEDGTEWTEEELDSGAADDYLYETITFEDGKVTGTWRKES